MDERRDELHTSIHATHAVVGTELTFGSVTDKISAIVLQRKTPVGWFIGFAISFALFQLLLLTITNLLFNGIGLWGINQPVGLGRIRRLDLRDRLGNILVCRLDSGFCDAARSGEEQGVWNYLRHAGDGLARFGAALASVRDGVSAARGIGNAAGAFGAHD